MEPSKGWTAGKWKVRVEGTMSGRGPEVYVEGKYYDDGSAFVIAECGITETNGDGKGWKRVEDANVKEANAKLIRTAPELAEALRALFCATLNELTARNLPHEWAPNSAMGRAAKLLEEVGG